MLTTEVTPKMVAEWKQTFETYHGQMSPNRKTGIEIDEYFRKKYCY